MPTYYCDDYEAITGKKPGEDEESVTEPEDKAVWPDSPDVETK